MATACGLDFGTSNSTMGIATRNGGPRLLALEDGKPTIPSVLFFGFEDDTIHFGRAGVAEYVTGAEGRLMRSLKSVLGTSLIGDSTRVKARSYGFVEILGIFIAELKQRAEAELGGPVDSVVLGRPVHFVDDDAVADAEAQKQLEGAVRAQGFKHIEFQFEPIAAALDYERQVSDEQLALIVDLGGGTSDFTVIRVSPERSKKPQRADDILATAGVHVGGTDFDRLLSVAKVMPELGLGSETRDGKRYLPVAPYHEFATWHRINRLYHAKPLRDLIGTRNEARRPDLVSQFIALVEDRQGHRLAGAVEEAKIALSDATEHRFHFESRGAKIDTVMGNADLARALDNSVERIAATIDETLARAGVGAKAIDSLILTGGSTLVPVIVARLRAMFPDAALVRTDVLGSVGLGLAMEASRRFG
ncbi:MAG: Hsp70 family protein [Devosia sp.]|uniref:Hsp70 family protein n=1 Tax=Devosia sp. TaxID=1871048 RepID=UPI0026243306|nr:Hsp70 family protein [Devosia sp.]MDB5588294.1 Hsp70 family protein [Devosia sp.]